MLAQLKRYICINKNVKYSPLFKIFKGDIGGRQGV